MGNVKKNDQTVQLDTCATAVTTTFPQSQTWVFEGTTYTRDGFVGLLRGCIAATQKTKADHDTWHASVVAEKQQYDVLKPALAAFKKQLEVQYGADSPELAKYGFAPGHAPVKSAETKAKSAAKANATKAAKKAAVAAVKAPAAAEPVAPPPAPSPAAPTTPKS